MVIPASQLPDWAPDAPEPCWAKLGHDAKRERILDAAERVFNAHGLEAPMPTIAAAAGAGVGSLYRQFPSKHELLAALVIGRLGQFERATREALDRGGDAWEALTSMLQTTVARQSGDDFLGPALVEVGDHPQVIAARQRALAATDRLVAAARSQGTLRADASSLDLMLLFTATRAARDVDPDGWRRMLELLVDGLRAQGS